VQTTSNEPAPASEFQERSAKARKIRPLQSLMRETNQPAGAVAVPDPLISLHFDHRFAFPEAKVTQQLDEGTNVFR
jgi:hypothetical protein